MLVTWNWTVLTLIVMFIQAVTYGKSLPAAQAGFSHPHPVGLFLAGVALLVIDLLSFGPFVSDYTRYLPENTAPKRLFWAIYSGNVLATTAACALGAYLTALFGVDSDPITDVGQVSGKWALVIMGLSLIGSDVANGGSAGRGESSDRASSRRARTSSGICTEGRWARSNRRDATASARDRH